MVEAKHMCMAIYGIKKAGSKTVTVASRGCFREELNDLLFEMVKGLSNTSNYW